MNSMAKKKKRSASKKKVVNTSPQHVLPEGFWSQVGAVMLGLFSLMIILGWFGLGGPIIDWINMATMNTIGYGVYVVPVVFLYVMVEIFRAQNNRIPFVMKFATAIELVWFAGLFGLLKAADGSTTGGFIGETVNEKVMLMLVDGGVAAFIYVLLILLTALFIIRVSPFTIIKKIWEMTRRDTKEHDANVKVMRNAAAIDKPKTAMADFKMNAGVPTLGTDEPSDKKSTPLNSMRNSVVKDKVAEDQAALVTVNDPNWKAPSVDLLEKKQSPADPGDVQQNAQTIKDTLAEFNIHVEMEGANIGPKVTQYTLRPSPPSGMTRSLGPAVFGCFLKSATLN